MNLELYIMLNSYAIIITVAGLILPALIIYFYSSYKNHLALIICAALFVLIGISVGDKAIILLPFMLPVLFSAIAGSYLRRTGEEFWHSMGYVILAELFGIMLGIMIIYFSYGRQELAQLIAQGFQNAYQNISPNDEISMFNLNVMIQILMTTSQGAIPEYSQINAMSVAEKLEIITPQIKVAMAEALPSTIMGYGIISGVSAWFISSVMLARRIRNDKKLLAVKEYTPHPKFSSWKMPRWMTNIIMFLLLTAIIIQFAAVGTMLNVASALQSTALTIMSIQGLAVINWWLKKKKVKSVPNTIICIFAVLLVSVILPWIGLVDIIFSVRTQDKQKKIIKMRMEEIRRQVDEQMKEMEEEKNSGKDTPDKVDDNNTEESNNENDDESEGKK